MPKSFQRGQQTLEKRQRIKTEQLDSDEVPQKRFREALGTSQSNLVTCFVCGKVDLANCRPEEMLWFSCSNSPVCKAWAHKICSGGLGNICQFCNVGRWRQKEVLGSYH
ncbi:hypothetical protein Y032_0018g3528 [Ancylostoma ceylanicum]|uniref:Uncharacterized protein n=1 Tax=Ancylostoma ceylanicum TaxID=53326 RepID=A0A016V4W5_9BILA|nr:hypothetical protein Y032_0018g3528 [Ancylostoma ceylanicum]